MAKSFYNQQEACSKLGMTPEQLADLVRNGQLREFRDAGKVNYKADEIEKLASATSALDDTPAGSLSGSLSEFDMLSTGELTLDDTGRGGSGAVPTSDSMEFKLAPDEDESKPADKPKPPAKPGAKAPAKADSGSGTDILSLSDDSMGATGDLVLEPVGEEDDSGINLAGSGPSDQISLDDTTAAGEEDERESTRVSSIGVSVFDDDEVEQDADPLAQTVVSGGSGGLLGVDSTGSGSGLLDLTRESDDTSLGAELLDEIYPADEGGGEMGEATRAGLAEDLPESEEVEAFVPSEEVARRPAAAVRTRVEFAPDAVSTGLTGMLFVSVLVMCIAGLAAAATAQDAWPALLDILYKNNLIVGAASLGALLLALGIGYFIGKRGGQ